MLRNLSLYLLINVMPLSMPVYSPNTGKYGPEKTPYLDTYNAVLINAKISRLDGSP